MSSEVGDCELGGGVHVTLRSENWAFRRLGTRTSGLPEDELEEALHVYAAGCLDMERTRWTPPSGPARAPPGRRWRARLGAAAELLHEERDAEDGPWLC